MDENKIDDKEFLDIFFNDELTEDGLIELDKRLKNPSFKKYYNERLDEKYKSSGLKLFLAYLPMILLLGLSILGIYLILNMT